VTEAGYWNHNVHYQRVILDAVPAGCGPAIDVGCGDGLLARALAPRCASVTGIDRAPAILARARAASTACANVTYLEGDFLSYPLEDASFDFACANTALHHMDFAAALTRLAAIIRPGGRLAVVGLANDASPADLIAAAAGLPLEWYCKLTKNQGNSGAPIMDPDMSWSQVRATARRLLPGVRYRRHLLWRYSLLWNKPALPRTSRRVLLIAEVAAPHNVAEG
jgi:SAM-dependent methyltransferase